MNTQTTSKTTDLTPAQQKVLDYIKTSGGLADSTVLQARGHDLRAANNLVRKNLLTLTNGIYRLVKPAKKAEAEKEPSTQRPTEEKAAETVKEPAIVEVPAVREPAKEEPAAKEPTEKAEAAEPAKATKKGDAAKKPVKNVELRPCLCGCGSPSKARFLPGHDARLHSIVLKIHRGKMGRDEMTDAPATLDYLKTAPWMTDEIAASIRL